MKILIVDDEVTLRRMFRLALEGPHEVHDAVDGPSALEALETHGPFDVVVLDQKMPGMTGIDVLRSIRQRAPDTRVVMLTAYASLDLAAEAMREGATHFLSKPTTPDTLRAAINAARRRPQPGAEDTDALREPVTTRDNTAITLNGFTVDVIDQPVTVDRDGSAVHRFRVTHALQAWEKSVFVRIAPRAFHRTAHRDFDPAGQVARLVARRVVAEFLWREGLVPPDEGLTVDEIDNAHLSAALREASDA